MINYFLNKQDTNVNINKTLNSIKDVYECVKNDKHPYYILNNTPDKLSNYTKDDLPYINFSLEYNTKRSNEDIKKYNPVISIDIDLKAEIKEYYKNKNNADTDLYKDIDNTINSLYNIIKEVGKFTLLKHSFNRGIHIIIEYSTSQLSFDNYNEIHRKVYKLFYNDFLTIVENYGKGYFVIDLATNKPTQLIIMNYDNECEYNDYIKEIKTDLLTSEFCKNEFIISNIDKEVLSGFFKYINNNKIELFNSDRIPIYYMLFSIYGTDISITDIRNELKSIYYWRVKNTKETYNKKICIEFNKYKRSFDVNKWTNDKTYSIFKKYGFKYSDSKDEFNNDYDKVIKLDNDKYLSDIKDVLNPILDSQNHIILKGKPGLGKTTFFINYLNDYLKDNPNKKVVYVSPKNLILEQIFNEHKDKIKFELLFNDKTNNNNRFILSSLNQLHKIIYDARIGIIIFDEIQSFIEYSTFNIPILKHNKIFDYKRKYIFISATPQLFKTLNDFYYINIENSNIGLTNYTIFSNRLKEYLLSELKNKRPTDFIYLYKNDKTKIESIKRYLLRQNPELKIGEITNSINMDIDLYNNIKTFNSIPEGYDLIISTDKVNEGININNTNIHKVIIDYSYDTNVFKMLQMRYRFRKMFDKDIFLLFVKIGYVKENIDKKNIYDYVNRFKDELNEIIMNVNSDCIRVNKTDKRNIIDFEIKKNTYLFQDSIDTNKYVYTDKNKICKKCYDALENEIRRDGYIFDYIKLFFNLKYIKIDGEKDENTIIKPINNKEKKQLFVELYNKYATDILNHIKGESISGEIEKDDIKIIDTYKLVFTKWMNRINELKDINFNDSEFKIITLRNERYRKKYNRLLLKYLNDQKKTNIDMLDENLIIDLNRLKGSINDCNVYLNRKTKKKYIKLNEYYEKYISE